MASRVGVTRFATAPARVGPSGQEEVPLPASQEDRPPDVVPGEDKQPSNQPIEEQVRTEPLDVDEGPDMVIGQSAAGRATVEGGGEWPEPDAEPSGPAPGTDPALRAEIEERRRQP